MVGQSFIILSPEKVVFHKEPSLRSEQFTLSEPDEFLITGHECYEGNPAIVCVIKMNGKNQFYKVRFGKGGEAYLNASNFSSKTVFNKKDLAFLPRVYRGIEFDKVWNAAVDAVDSLGFVIKQMKREEGYIATDYKEDVGTLGFYGPLSTIKKRRTRVTIRLTSEDGLVAVSISPYIREFIQDVEPDISSWKDRPSDGSLEREIKSRMDRRLKLTGDQPG